MHAQLQRRVQRYGWDKAVDEYEAGWSEQLEPAQSMMLDMAALAPGERVLDVACGTGLVSFRAQDAVGPWGRVLGTDISGKMVAAARRRAAREGARNVAFERHDAEKLAIEGEPFDAALAFHCGCWKVLVAASKSPSAFTPRCANRCGSTILCHALRPRSCARRPYSAIRTSKGISMNNQ